MANLNKVMLIGNLTRDVELRSTPSGQSVAKIGLAINRNWTSPDGEKREEVTFVDCEAWGKSADIMAKYLSKGRPVFIEGRLKLDQWDDKETGKKQSKIKVVVESFQFLGDRQGAGGGGPGGGGAGGGGGGGGGGGAYDDEPAPARNPAPARGSGQRPAPRSAPQQDTQIHEDDIPF